MICRLEEGEVWLIDCRLCGTRTGTCGSSGRRKVEGWEDNEEEGRDNDGEKERKAEKEEKYNADEKRNK
jgi:hypothetical protein